MSGETGPDFELRIADWLDAGAAQARILEACPPPREEAIPVADALGRALVEDLRAEAALPPWDNAAMDGYAVRGADLAGASPATPVVLAVRGVVRAGDPPVEAVHAGEAVRIMTGAPVPPGADSVVRVEDTDAEAEPGRVRILGDRDLGANIRPGGQDMRPGDLILGRGDTVTPGTMAALVALGRTRVLVGRRPTVAVLTAGDELRTAEAYQDVRSGLGVPESNGPMLAAAVMEAGGVPRRSGPVADDPRALAAAVAAAADADVLVTVGGASMGEADLVKRVLDGAGFRQDFWRVTMRPGSPFGFGWLRTPAGEQPVFGLPGNPASAFVTFEVFVRPFLLRMAGHRLIHRRLIRCVAGESLAGGSRTVFARVRIDSSGGVLRAHATGPQGSGLVGGLSAAQGLAVIPSGSSVAAGEPLHVILLDPGPAASPVSPLEGLPA